MCSIEHRASQLLNALLVGMRLGSYVLSHPIMNIWCVYIYGYMYMYDP